MNMPTHKAIHIAKSLKNQPQEPKLVNKYVFANAQEKMKIVANLKDKMTENKECQCLTKAIRNLGNVLTLSILALNKISGKLKINRFKIPNYA